MNNLKLFFGIRKPIVFVSGNHEYYLRNFREKLSSLKEYNINFLDNMSFNYKELNIIGISDDVRLNKKKNLTTKLFKKNFLNLVLVHIIKINFSENRKSYPFQYNILQQNLL